MLALIWVCWDVMRHAPVSLGALRVGIDGWRDFSLLWAGLAFASLILGGNRLEKETIISGSTSKLSSSRYRVNHVRSHSIVGLTGIIALTLVTMGVFAMMYHFGLVHFGPPVVVSVERAIQTPLSFLTVFLAGCSMALFAGLVFSTSCLATVLVRRASLGILLAAVAFIFYIFLQREMQYLPGPFHPNLPNWQLNPFDILISRNNVVTRLLVAVLGRSLTILPILYIAHLAAARLGSGNSLVQNDSALR
jgi:hypothetical protein